MENLNSATAEATDTIVSVVELTVPARVDRLPIVRGLVENVLLTDDFGLDTVADLKVGVDESCTELIALADTEAASLQVVVTTGPQRVQIEVCCAVGDSTVDVTSFGWYVIECVADDVSVAYAQGARGREARITLTTVRD